MAKNQDRDQETAVVAKSGFSAVELAEISSFDDVARLAGGVENVVNVADVAGDGFAVLKDKAKLIGVPFVIVSAAEYESSEVKGKTFTSLHVLTRTGEKYIVNDGSTGIHQTVQQMRASNEGNVPLPMYVPNGLRRSQYEYTDDKGQVKNATTYYLDTSK